MHIFYIAFVISQMAFCASVNGKGIYSVVAPGTIHSNRKYNVAVSLHESDEHSKMEIGITGPSFNETKTVYVKPMSTESVEFDVPHLASGTYSLNAKGISGLSFENSTKLNLGEMEPAAYIQTDKAKYKPGDLVQFRVIFLDENTKPAKIEKPISIVIKDGAQNRIKQIDDVKITKGVYTGKLQLSEEPILGQWSIEVTVDGAKTTDKAFDVEKYVLPKFDVVIETDKDVAIPDGVIKATIRAKYTYGKPVKGTAIVNVESAYRSFGGINEPTASKTVPVDGKGQVEFDLTKDLSLTRFGYGAPLKIMAIMTEELTGNKQNATTTINLHESRYVIEGVDIPNTYHPNKTMKITFVVKKLDGSPVQDSKNKAKLYIEKPRMFYLPGTTSQPVLSEEESDLDANGMAHFMIAMSDNNSNTYFSLRGEYMDAKGFLGSVHKFRPELEQDTELLKINLVTKKPQLKKPFIFDVRSREPLTYFIYTIVARGNILKMERVDVPEGQKSQKIEFMPTFEMIPSIELYVHYVVNGDLVFIEKTVDFEKSFENYIDISTPAISKPGEEVELKVDTSPDSYVGLLGVDQSVLLLKSGNDFNKDSILSKLSSYKSETPDIRGYGTYPGKESGLVTLTNAKYPFNDDDWFYPAVLDIRRPDSGIRRPDSGIRRPGSGIRRPDSGIVYYFHSDEATIFDQVEEMVEHNVNEPIAPPKIRENFPENWIFLDQNK